MKHIALFEYYSEMPKDFSVQEIKNMTKDQFLTAFKKYVDAEDEEQAFSISQIWTRANRDALQDANFIVKYSDAAGKYRDVLFLNKEMEYDNFRSGIASDERPNQIARAERDIAHYEEMLRMTKERLARLRSSSY